MEKFKVGESRFGKGVFATEPIKKGEHICFLKGKEVGMEELERLVASGEEREGDALQIGIKKYIDLDEPYLRFNHSCEPNTIIRGKNKMVAIQDIKSGEEVTYDYSATMWDDEWSEKHTPWTMKCECESKNCRGIVKDFPTLPKSVREKYIKEKNVPSFILDLVKKHGFSDTKQSHKNTEKD